MGNLEIIILVIVTLYWLIKSIPQELYITSGFRATSNRDRIHWYKCREYNHFTRDCPTSREEREIEHPQQMVNLGDEQTITPPMSDTQAEFSRVSSEENLRTNHLNL